MARQFEALVPEVQKVLDRAVKHTNSRFARFEAIVFGADKGGRPSLEKLVTAYADRGPQPDTYVQVVTCPSCGVPNVDHTPVTPGDDPIVGSVAICEGCGVISVFDFDPASVGLILRAPTEQEAAAISADPDVAQARRSALQVPVPPGRPPAVPVSPACDQGGLLMAQNDDQGNNSTDSGPAARPFADWLQELAKGGVHAEATARLAELIPAIQETGQAGELTIRIKIKPQPKMDGRAVLAEGTVSAKVPAPTAATSLFFINGPSLVRNDPDQLPLTGLREVPAAAVRPRSATR